ncbi:hypothetical protein K9B35_00090 [Sphingomonas sp. R647]|uniref:glycosyltransferase n=1 Tax=Sphingomonas sp. R647 TaxID=2875233 RepID=UPI001CD4B666|nr:glycosyltransferase [Sphingomonas sp. R647]MCA1196353.1 hypothetical protein [Sphingomonas sp. R647]
MILVSVGTQLPFDRLTRTVDAWAMRHGIGDIFAQIGPSNYVPSAMEHVDFLEPDLFRRLQEQCTLMVSHAGMGSIITAMELGKPIIIMARDHRRKEHRNGHQFSTLKQFANVPGVYPCTNEDELTALLERSDSLTATPSLEAEAPSAMIDALASYIGTIAAERRQRD